MTLRLRPLTPPLILSRTPQTEPGGVAGWCAGRADAHAGGRHGVPLGLHQRLPEVPLAVLRELRAAGPPHQPGGGARAPARCVCARALLTEESKKPTRSATDDSRMVDYRPTHSAAAAGAVGADCAARLGRTDVGKVLLTEPVKLMRMQTQRVPANRVLAPFKCATRQM